MPAALLTAGAAACIYHVTLAPIGGISADHKGYGFTSGEGADVGWLPGLLSHLAVGTSHALEMGAVLSFMASIWIVLNLTGPQDPTLGWGEPGEWAAKAERDRRASILRSMQADPMSLVRRRRKRNSAWTFRR